MIRLMDKILHDPKDPKTMGNMVYSLLWVMQDFVHQPSTILGLPYRILHMNPKKELLWNRWVGIKAFGLVGLRA